MTLKFPTKLLSALALSLSVLQQASKTEAWSTTASTSRVLPRISKNPRMTNTGLSAKLDGAVQDGNHQKVLDRRKAIGALSTAVFSGLLLNSESASAYEKTFPVELNTIDADTRTPRQRALEASAASRPKTSAGPTDLGLGALLWGSALWFLTGSRSNPLATPLANLLYNSEDEQWLQDRNDGLFAALPPPLLFLLGGVFVLLGFVVHLAAISLAEGSVDISLQLAVVLLIGSGTLEIGRIASGEKKQTRTDYDRDAMLEHEFEDFAERRLQLGGNCHRSDVVKAFRRFHAKYRQADNPDYPLNDLEIEQLLKQWNGRNAGAQRSSAGFYSGIQINPDADIAIQR